MFFFSKNSPKENFLSLKEIISQVMAHNNQIETMALDGIENNQNIAWFKITYKNSDEYIISGVNFSTDKKGEKEFTKWALEKLKEESFSKRKEKNELVKILKEVLPNHFIEIHIEYDKRAYSINVVPKDKEYAIKIYLLNGFLISVKQYKFSNNLSLEKTVRFQNKAESFSVESLTKTINFLNQ